MKNERQIVLFFEKNIEFNQTQLAAKLNEKFSELGNPVILPPSDRNREQPLIIFNQSYINMTVSYNAVSFIFSEDDKDNCDKLVIRIMEILEEFGLYFIRMGYVSTYVYGKKERKNFKSIAFKDSIPINDDFQLAWYSKELIDSVAVNVWERYFTDLANKLEFASVFDINTPVEEEYNISSEFVEDFCKKCDKFIEAKLKDRL